MGAPFEAELSGDTAGGCVRPPNPRYVYTSTWIPSIDDGRGLAPAEAPAT